MWLKPTSKRSRKLTNDQATRHEKPIKADLMGFSVARNITNCFMIEFYMYPGLTSCGGSVFASRQL